MCWRLRRLDDDTILSAVNITAVFLVAVRDGEILAVKNERGWDLPGGHVEAGETPLVALRREVSEEAAASFPSATPCALMGMGDSTDVMAFYASDSYELSTFRPTDDALERQAMPIDRFMELYRGPSGVMRVLIDAAAVAMKRAV
ncbi:MAG TPA: NUDIX domain-containing protein [Bryobacteraceae bacterium]|nr:NUDIX domain-containing protein [Bryobacteraceae bacterium]